MYYMNICKYVKPACRCRTQTITNYTLIYNRKHLGDLRGQKIAVWGIAFKPKTDDIRESPAIQLIDSVLADGGVVSAHDPIAATCSPWGSIRTWFRSAIA